jgi:hypothetical protein
MPVSLAREGHGEVIAAGQIGPGTGKAMLDHWNTGDLLAQSRLMCQASLHRNQCFSMLDPHANRADRIVAGISGYLIIAMLGRSAKEFPDSKPESP